LSDSFAGFRDSFTGEVDGYAHWLDVDYALATAMQVVEDYTDNETGHLVFVEQSDRVTFDASKYTKKSIAAVERRTKGSAKKPYEASPGERWRTIPRVMDGGVLPTLFEWLAEQDRKKG
jgi:hypothetical protein